MVEEAARPEIMAPLHSDVMRRLLPAGWDMVAAELAGLFSVVISTPHSEGTLVIDTRSWERLLALPSGPCSTLRRVLMAIGDERIAAETGDVQRQALVSMRADDDRTWSQLQILAGVTSAIWIPPPYEKTVGSNVNRYRWLFEYRRVNRAISARVGV